MPVKQRMFHCLECSNSEESIHAMCFICRDTCHAGHKYVPCDKGNPITAVCDCGKGKYNGFKTLNNNNPLIKYKITENMKFITSDSSSCHMRYEWGFDNALRDFIEQTDLLQFQ